MRYSGFLLVKYDSPAPLIVTHPAAAKVWELMEEEGNFDLKLRVYVTGGGCSGLQYGFTFDETVNEDDTSVIKQLDGSDNAVQVLVDAMSFQYLVGSVIDYVEDLDGARFVIRNPNATTKCGCGSSFAVE